MLSQQRNRGPLRMNAGHKKTKGPRSANRMSNPCWQGTELGSQPHCRLSHFTSQISAATGTTPRKASFEWQRIADPVVETLQFVFYLLSASADDGKHPHQAAKTTGKDDRQGPPDDALPRETTDLPPSAEPSLGSPPKGATHCLEPKPVLRFSNWIYRSSINYNIVFDSSSHPGCRLA